MATRMPKGLGLDKLGLDNVKDRATQAWLRKMVNQIETIYKVLLDELTTAKTVFNADNEFVGGPWIDVRAYGAVGDGTTDDTAAVQSAIDYCNTNSLGTLYFPTGTYVVNAPLVVTQTRFNIIGSNMWRTAIVTGESWSGSKIIDCTGNKSWLSVRDLYIRGPEAAAGSPIGIYFDITVSVELKNVLFRRCGTAIDVDGNTCLRLDNVYTTGNYAGCELAGLRSVCATNCVFEASTTIGLWMSNVVGSSFHNLWFEQNGTYGLYAVNCRNNTFTGGYWSHDGTQDNIYFDSNAANQNNVFINLDFAGAKGIRNEAANPLYFIGCKSLPALTGACSINLNNRALSTLANDATPSVEGGDRWLTGGTTTITDFDDGFEGQILTILIKHDVDFTHGSGLVLAGAANWTTAADGDVIRLVYDGTNWIEVSRSDNT